MQDLSGSIKSFISYIKWLKNIRNLVFQLYDLSYVRYNWYKERSGGYSKISEELLEDQVFEDYGKRELFFGGIGISTFSQFHSEGFFNKMLKYRDDFDKFDIYWRLEIANCKGDNNPQYVDLKDFDNKNIHFVLKDSQFHRLIQSSRKFADEIDQELSNLLGDSYVFFVEGKYFHSFKDLKVLLNEKGY